MTPERVGVVKRRPEKLHEALVCGSVESAAKLMLRGALLEGDFRLTCQELEALDIGGLRLLVEHGYDLSEWLLESPGPAVRALLCAGLINTPCAHLDGQPETPLHFAIARGLNPLTAVVIACGADVDHPNNRGRTPLYTAIERGSPEAVRLLRRHGAKPILYRYYLDDPEEALFRQLGVPSASRLPLVFAAGVRDSAELIAEVLEMTADPNERDDAGVTALHAATAYGHLQNVRALLADGRVDPNVRDADHMTPYDLTPCDQTTWDAIRRALQLAGSQLPPGMRPHRFFSLAAIRSASSLRGVVFPFGFGPGEVLAHADLAYCDLSRTSVSLGQIAELKTLEGIALPAGMELPEEYRALPGMAQAEILPALPEEPMDEWGLAYRRLRAAKRTIFYRRVHRLEHLGGGPGLENVDLRPISDVITPEVLRRYEWFSEVVFPRGLDLVSLGQSFFAEREFYYCDFSEAVNFPAYAWSEAAAMIGARCPPGVDFQRADFRDADLRDTDFSLQIPPLDVWF